VLDAFIDTVLAPMEVLSEHLQCFKLLCLMFALLRMGDRCLDRLDLLRNTMYEHHVMFMRLYPSCGKPKLHYLRHVVDCFAYWKRCLNCFSTERKHRYSKKIASFVFNRMTKSLLAHDLCHFFDLAKDPTTFTETRIQGIVKPLPALQEVFGMRGAVVNVFSATIISTVMGNFHKGVRFQQLYKYSI